MSFIRNFKPPLNLTDSTVAQFAIGAASVAASLVSKSARVDLKNLSLAYSMPCLDSSKSCAVELEGLRNCHLGSICRRVPTPGLTKAANSSGDNLLKMASSSSVVKV